MRLPISCFALWGMAAFGQDTLTITPEVLTQCNAAGLTAARLAWRTVQPAVQVRIGSESGPPMTGFEPGVGTVLTGEWVGDGLVFVLVSPNGREVARAAAVVRCQQASANLNTQLATQSYWPLEVGNRWVYRWSDRLQTASYLRRWVDRTVLQGGETWYVIQEQGVPGGSISETLWRTDDEGRIYRPEGLFLDPNSPGDPRAAAAIQQRNLMVNSPVGPMANALSYTASGGALLQERGTLARGVGLVAREQNLIAGSSGGFANGLELVEAVIAGKVRFSSPAFGLELAPEFLTMDLTGRQVRNCALPCYFAACGLGGGQPDPPGTYKPCMFTRLKLTSPAARTVRVELLGGADEPLFSVDRPMDGTAQEQLWFERIPLYRGASDLLPPGAYRLRVTVKSEQGETLNTATTALRID